MNKQLHLTTWDNIVLCCRDIANQIKKDNITFDLIVTIPRGGLVPARLIADQLEINTVYTLNHGILEPDRERFKTKSVLFVDDIYDTGKTIDSIKQHFLFGYLKTATLFIKEDILANKPDYYAVMVSNKDWIVFPWEMSQQGE